MEAKTNFHLIFLYLLGEKKKNTNQDLPVYPFEAQNFNIRLHMGCGLTLADS